MGCNQANRDEEWVRLNEALCSGGVRRKRLAGRVKLFLGGLCGQFELFPLYDLVKVDCPERDTGQSNPHITHSTKTPTKDVL